MQETWVQSLGWEDPLEKGKANPLQYSWASLVAQMVKNPPAMQETRVRSLGWEDPLEEGMATPPVFLPGESPWIEEPGGTQSMGLQSWTQLSEYTHHSYQCYIFGTAILS